MWGLMWSLKLLRYDACQGCKVPHTDSGARGLTDKMEQQGLSSVKRQRLVYKAIWQELMETVHAVDAMTTKTPAEAGQ